MTKFLNRGVASVAPSPADVAVALGLDPNTMVPQAAFMRPPQGGMFANSTRPVCVGPPFNQFFATNYPPALKMADTYGADVTSPLGLAANESAWGRSPMARNQNNPVGATPNGVNGVTYASPSSAWQNWGQQWGPRINGVGGDADLFLNRLLMDNRGVEGAVDQRGPYNTQKAGKTHGSPDWKRNTRGAIDSVRERLPFWLASGC